MVICLKSITGQRRWLQKVKSRRCMSPQYPIPWTPLFSPSDILRFIGQWAGFTQPFRTPLSSQCMETVPTHLSWCSRQWGGVQGWTWTEVISFCPFHSPIASLFGRICLLCSHAVMQGARTALISGMRHGTLTPKSRWLLLLLVLLLFPPGFLLNEFSSRWSSNLLSCVFLL